MEKYFSIGYYSPSLIRKGTKALSKFSFHFAVFLTLSFNFINNVVYSQAVPSGVVLVPMANPKAGTGPGFGIDGDLKAYLPSPGQFENAGDWLPDINGEGGVFTAAGLVPQGADIKRVIHASDNYGANDNIFKGGSKIDSDPGSVKWVTGGPNPSKNDINNALVYIAEDAGGHIWAIMSGDRATKEGNSFIAFQFLQKSVTKNPNGTFTNSAQSGQGGRTEGDIQITAEFVNGGTVPNLYYESWQSVGGTFTWVSIATPPAGAAFGSTNGAVLTGVPYSPFGGTSYDVNLFAEVAVDITEVYKNVPTTCVGKISTLWVVSKSSQSSSANMTDFVDPISLDLKLNVVAAAGPDKEICAGGSVTIGTASQAGFDYSWSPSTGLSNANIAQPTASPTSTTTYTLTVTKTGSTCSSTDPVEVKVNANPTITASIGAICAGTANASFTYSGITGGANQFTIDWDSPGPTDISYTNLTASPMSISGFGSLTAATYSGTLKVKNSTTGCESAGIPISITVNANPGINTPALGAICPGVTNPNLSYTGVTNGANQYKIVWNPAAVNAGLVSMGAFVSLPASPFTLTISNSIVPGTYSGTIFVRNSNTTCESAGDPISLLINGTPGITTPAIGAICPGATSASLTYNGVSNGANQYKIVWNPAAVNAGLVSMMAFAGLPASPISIGNTSGLTAGTYNGTIFMKNSSTTCESSGDAISLVVNARPNGPTVIYIAPACDESTFKLRIPAYNSTSTYTVKDKSGASIPGLQSSVVPNQNNPNINDLLYSNIPAGSGYRVTETSSENCLSEATTCGVPNPVRQSNPQSFGTNTSTEMKAYPVPFHEKVTIQFTAEKDENFVVNLYDLQGKLIRELKTGNAQAGEVITIEVSGEGMRESMYLVRKVSKSGISTVKLLKKE